VLLADSAGLTSALNYVATRRPALDLAADAIDVRFVTFDFFELWTFYVAVFAATFGTAEHVTAIAHLDIDEVENRVTVGLADPGRAESIEAQILQRGVPREAFQIIEAARSVPRQSTLNLRHTFTKRPGGVLVAAEDHEEEPCSLWLSAQINGTAIFASAAHCSTKEFRVDSGAWFQNDSGPRIGEEHWDTQGSTGSMSPGGGLPDTVCVTPCRYSDFQYGFYDDSTAALHGRIARTQSAGYLQPGSLDLHSTKPYWGVGGKLDMFYQGVGQWLSKVGAKSGWTRGQITHTCQDIYLPSPWNVLLLCQHRSSIWSEGGDSGSPIFYENGQGTDPSHWDWVYVAGILHGGPDEEWDITDFSTVQGIDEDLPSGHGPVDVTLWCWMDGSNPTFPCSHHTVAIDGPNVVSCPGTHQWEAMPSGFSGPYSYQWFVEYLDSSTPGGYLGTSKVQELGVVEIDGDFMISVEVTSQFGQGEGEQLVLNDIGTDPLCDPNGNGNRNDSS